jgi:cytochrome P450
MEQRQIQSEVLLQVVAGSDTTATAIRMTVFFLATNPQAYARLQKEIDEGIATGKISTPITNAEGKALPYLQAVIRESIRFHPPVFNLLPKVVPRGGDTLCGQFVPGGTEIGVNPWSMVRRPEIFGDDPDVFRPERWLEASSERRAEMEKVGELIFGHGRFMCAGKVLAFMELNKTFVEASTFLALPFPGFFITSFVLVGGGIFRFIF